MSYKILFLIDYYDVKCGEDGYCYLCLLVCGFNFICILLFNKGIVFIVEECEVYGFDGLFVLQVDSLEVFIECVYCEFFKCGVVLEKYVYLCNL